MSLRKQYLLPTQRSCVCVPEYSWSGNRTNNGPHLHINYGSYPLYAWYTVDGIQEQRSGVLDGAVKKSGSGVLCRPLVCLIYLSL